MSSWSTDSGAAAPAKFDCVVVAFVLFGAAEPLLFGAFGALAIWLMLAIWGFLSGCGGGESTVSIAWATMRDKLTGFNNKDCH